MCIRRGGDMERIIVKNCCDFAEFGKVLDKDFLVCRARNYFKARGIDLDFSSEISGDRYIEIMHSGALNRADKNFLLAIFQKGFGKRVAFIKSEPMFFALVDDFVPAVI